MLQRTHELLDGCIGCGCLSLDRCALFNPNYRAARAGPGPRFLLGDKASDFETRWCANGLRSKPSSWCLQSPPPNGDWHTQTCHSIEHIAADLCFVALIEQTPSAKSPANDGLVTVDCCLDQAPSIVTRPMLPSYSTMLFNHRNMPVALTRRFLVRNCCRTRRNDNRSPGWRSATAL